MTNTPISPKPHRTSSATSKPTHDGVGPVLARNMTNLAELRRHDERTRSRQDRVADGITRFTGSMAFVYLHALFFGGWLVVNLGWTPLPTFDPSFVVLAMMASVEAIFLSTFVLISQNRMAKEAEKRAELDLQVSLLAEHEVSRIAALLDAVATHLGVEHDLAPAIEQAKEDIDPATVSRAITSQGDGTDTPGPAALSGAARA